MLPAVLMTMLLYLMVVLVEISEKKLVQRKVTAVWMLDFDCIGWVGDLCKIRVMQ